MGRDAKIAEGRRRRRPHVRAAVLQHMNRQHEAAEHFSAALRVTPNNGVW